MGVVENCCETFVFIVVLFGLLCSSPACARDFYVGGDEGWILRPKESYEAWAGRNRFQINDTIVFEYNKGQNSVLVVNEADFNSCITKNPIKRFDNGENKVIFSHSGPFFFISGSPEKCHNGQKLSVIVLSIRKSPAVTLPSSPSPSTSLSSSSSAVSSPHSPFLPPPSSITPSPSLSSSPHAPSPTPSSSPIPSPSSSPTAPFFPPSPSSSLTAPFFPPSPTSSLSPPPPPPPPPLPSSEVSLATHHDQPPASTPHHSSAFPSARVAGVSSFLAAIIVAHVLVV